ncbi:hypothetical protein GCK32_010793, partial [Trichostrongylus colubriformis]
MPEPPVNVPTPAPRISLVGSTPTEDQMSKPTQEPTSLPVGRSQHEAWLQRKNEEERKRRQKEKQAAKKKEE